MSGYVRLHRSLIGHPAFRNDAEAMAFAWLIAKAAWKPVRVRYKERSIHLKRGQLAMSQRDMARALDRDKAWVERLWKRLRAEAMITTNIEAGVALITICNYAHYQSIRADREAPDEAHGEAGARQGQGTEQGREEVKKESSVAKATSPRAKPRSKFPPPPNVSDEQWQAFNDQRKKPLTARAYALIGNKLLKVSAESGWPPGELIDLAVERGWETVFAPRTFRNERSNSPSPVDQLVAASFAFSNGVGEDTEAGGADLDGRSGADSVARFGH